jgi:hypothetical protein
LKLAFHATKFSGLSSKLISLVSIKSFLSMKLGLTDCPSVVQRVEPQGLAWKTLVHKVESEVYCSFWLKPWAWCVLWFLLIDHFVLKLFLNSVPKLRNLYPIMRFHAIGSLPRTISLSVSKSQRLN